MRHLSVLLLLLLLPVLALAEGLELAAPQEPIRPGRAVQLEFSVPETLPVSLSLLDGEEGHPIVSGWNAREGRNTVWWNGTFDGVPVAEGEYRLVLTQGSRLVSAPVTIGPVAPYLTGLSADRALITPDSPLNLGFYASEPGTVTYGISVDGQWKRLGSMSVEAGDCSLTWQPSQDMADGEAVFTLRLRGTTGELSDMAQCPVSVSGFSAGEPERYVFDDDEEIRDVWGEMPEETEALGDSGTVSAEEDYPPEMEQVPNLGSGGGADGDVFTPVWGSPYAGVDQTLNYWTLPMDITDEAAVWHLRQPGRARPGPL